MIVRVFSEAQYEVDDSVGERLRELDRPVEAAIASGDEAAFRAAYGDLLGLVRREGRQLPDDDLRGSDLMLPPADLSLHEARQEFSARGLTPD